MRHTVILSDVHLWQCTSNDGLWMRYRHERFSPDAGIAELLEHVTATCGADTLELVFNGDIFDFDVLPVEAAHIVERHPPRSEASSARTLAAILDDHRTFVAAVADVLAAGHRVIFVSGNHDVHLCFAAVRRLLADRILDEAQRRSPGIERDEADTRILFRGWFHRTDDGIHIEHGNQYDRYCSIRYPMQPIARDGRRVQPTMGSLVMRHLIGRLGYFNPNVDSSFLLTTRAYIDHWIRYYLFSRRSLALAWALGSLRVAFELLLDRECADSTRSARELPLAEAETGVDAAVLEAHAAKFALPSLRHAASILRVDRLMAALLLLAAIGAGWLTPWLALPFVVLLGILIWAMRSGHETEELGEVYGAMTPRAIEIANLHGARAIVFGHTHVAGGQWVGSVFVGNCGTWAPAFHDVECVLPVEIAKPFIWLWTDGARIGGGLLRWDDGEKPLPGGLERRLDDASQLRIAITHAAETGSPLVGELAATSP